jgi:hypothetical protein
MESTAATGEALDYGDGDNGGFDVVDEVDVGDLSTQQGGDAIAPQKKVRFEIRKITVRPYVPQGKSEWLAKYLSLDLVVGPDGITVKDDDGNEEQKYAGKHFFQDLLLVKNVEAYPEENTEKYKTSGRFDLKVFLKAMGYDPAKPPRINDDLLISLTGREVYADITRKAKQARTGQTDSKGKDVWEATGEFKNEIKNFRSVEAS